MKSSVVTVGLTQTRNAYAAMPKLLDELPALIDKLDDIRAANLAHHEELIRRAHKQNAQVICLGELFTAPYFALESRSFWRDMAEDAHEGPSVVRLKHLAKELQMVVVAPIYEYDKQIDARYNTAVVIDASGDILGTYRKTHIPKGNNEIGGFNEPYYYIASDREPYFPVFETRYAKIGVSICYDRHFEGVMRSLASQGCSIILNPSVTFGAKSKRMWELEFEVDACRHNVFIGGSNREGCEPPWNVEYFGGSYFVGPEGRLANLSNDSKIIISKLDLSLLQGGDTSGWDLNRDNRKAIYEK